MAETKEAMRSRLKAMRKKHGLGEFKKGSTKTKTKAKKSPTTSRKPVSASRFVSVSVRGLV